jgi:hypothetical protein
MMLTLPLVLAYVTIGAGMMLELGSGCIFVRTDVDCLFA